jgi:predicted Zn-dependent peptidase
LALGAPGTVRLEDDTAQTQIGLIYPDVSFGHPEFYSARLGAEVLSGGSGSRLFSEVREKRGLVYSVYASPGGVKGYSYLSAYAGTTPARAGETLRVLQGEIERLSQGVSAEELERAKIGLRTALVMGEELARARVGGTARDLYVLGRVHTLEDRGGDRCGEPGAPQPLPGREPLPQPLGGPAGTSGSGRQPAHPR